MNQYDYLLKFIIIGNTSVGKSCILSKFIDGRFKREHDATIGVEFGSKNIEIDGKTIKIQIWDTAGQESFRSITRSYFRGSVGALIVYDVTKKDSFNDMGKWMNDIAENANKHLSVVMIGNKSDLDNREVFQSEGESFANERSYMFYETSAFSGENIEIAFRSLATEVLRRINNNQIDLNDQSCGVKIGQKKGRPIAINAASNANGHSTSDKSRQNLILDSNNTSNDGTNQQYKTSQCAC